MVFRVGAVAGAVAVDDESEVALPALPSDCDVDQSAER